MIEVNTRGTDISIFSVLDGHGGEFAAVFAKEQLMERMRQKIEEANNIVLGKDPPSPTRSISNQKNGEETEKPTETNDDSNKNTEKPKTPLTQKRNLMMKKSLSTDVDCKSKQNCHQEQEAFLNKLNSVHHTKESLLRINNNVVKPTEHPAIHYVDRDKKINFGKMITDLVLLTDYELIEKAKKQVRSPPYCFFWNLIELQIVVFLNINFFIHRKMSLGQRFCLL